MTGRDSPKIVVEGLCKSFAGERVLDGVDLSVADGGSLVLLGESGSGKTLTLKCIMGLVRPDSGTIRIDGQDTVSLAQASPSPVRVRGIGPVNDVLVLGLLLVKPSQYLVVVGSVLGSVSNVIAKLPIHAIAV